MAPTTQAPMSIEELKAYNASLTPAGQKSRPGRPGRGGSTQRVTPTQQVHGGGTSRRSPPTSQARGGGGGYSYGASAPQRSSPLNPNRGSSNGYGSSSAQRSSPLNPARGGEISYGGPSAQGPALPIRAPVNTGNDVSHFHQLGVPMR